MIGIIGAMEEEVKALLDKTEDIHENKILDCVFYEGKIDNKQVVILQGGIGKVNSAICVTLLLTNYDIDYVINIGSAGGLKDYQNVGDVVISSHVAYHDVGLTAFGRPMGELPELPVFIPADENLVNKAKDILHKMNIHENVGLIVSGDQFIAQEGQVSKIKKDFPNALCSEMEASAIGHTCYKFGVPFIITRSLSDVYGHGESSMQFDEYLKQVKLDHKEEAKKKYQKPLDTYHGIVVVDIPQSFAEVKKDTAQFTISGWSLSDCLNDRLKVTFDDQEVTEMRKINRSDVLMAYQEKYGGYGTNDDECGFDYFVDVSQMELGEHSILVQLLDEKDKVISEKDLKINII